ncbi:phosphatase [Lunatimonas salinarum]|uniref:Ppx/GppA phosphatase family protein n=1 Tax=Lunatimonas salinarum TaxID=1774590 RepID=UPI001ADED21E|nr:phosphatase [Lunatimonas salinarum]
MKLAAVDIGSNAIRLQITNVTHFQGAFGLKKLEYVRFPLRLGKDVFLNQEISPVSRAKFVRLMGVFKELMELYEVDHYMVCATSAMRESKNGEEIVREVSEKIGLKIEIIDGDREAELIDKALWSSIDTKTYLHVDVGGGSTELNIYKKKQKVGSRSFRIGSVRTLDEQHVPLSIWRDMEAFITERLGKEQTVTCIGTGGNINKIMELSKPRKNKRYLDKHTIKSVQELLLSYSYEERMHLLNLNPDRADVIIPASKIYLAAMDAARSVRMIVPDIGLKDGLMHLLFERAMQDAPDVIR